MLYEHRYGLIRVTYNITNRYPPDEWQTRLLATSWKSNKIILLCSNRKTNGLHRQRNARMFKHYPTQGGGVITSKY